jgi:hypothetical protein
MQREIPKLPEVPDLTPNLIKSLSELCFRNESDLAPHISDTVFVFGTAVSFDKAAEAIEEVLERVNPRRLVLSGGMPTYPDSYKVTKPESRLLYDSIQKLLPKDLEVFLEETSNNCIENVQNALPFLKDSHQITFITKSFGAGRHYLTLKKFLPNVQYTQKTFNPLYPGSTAYVAKEDWYVNSHSIMRVWGEFLRIAKYGQRGDIAYDEVKSLLDNIAIQTHAEAS